MASAATCADYPNQAAAQWAADTRDADGIYCESLPCPCSTAPPGSAAPRPLIDVRPDGRPVAWSRHRTSLTGRISGLDEHCTCVSLR